MSYKIWINTSIQILIMSFSFNMKEIKYLDQYSKEIIESKSKNLRNLKSCIKYTLIIIWIWYIT